MKIERNPDGSFVIPNGHRVVNQSEWVQEWDRWPCEEEGEWYYSLSWRRHTKPNGATYIRKIEDVK